MTASNVPPISAEFQELDYRPTALGDLVLRKRRDPRIGDTDIYEVKLGEDFLMSSLFHDSEVALADMGLTALGDRQRTEGWDVVVGGLGLGYTARAALRHRSVGSLLVVELLDGVIDWHRQHLVPLGESLTADPRCRIVQGDFFELAQMPQRGFDNEQAGRRFDAVLLDIDHAPGKLIDSTSSRFYQADGLQRMAMHLHPGGVFALWSDDAPEAAFTQTLQSVFPAVDAQVITFDNPYTGGTSACSVYVCRKA